MAGCSEKEMGEQIDAAAVEEVDCVSLDVDARLCYAVSQPVGPEPVTSKSHRN